jgi:chromosomal replication initiation ATPase DnaA
VKWCTKQASNQCSTRVQGTTVLHSINKIEELRRSDKDLNRTITADTQD